LKLFKEFDYKWTTWACARAFEVTGDYPNLLVQDGHEIACHGNRWRDHGGNSEQEKAHINQSFDRLQKATGLKDVPTGYYLGNGSIRQKLVRAEVRWFFKAEKQVHRDRGVPMLYCSDTYTSDVPYYIPNPLSKVYGEKDDGMLMIPYSACTNDHRCEFNMLFWPQSWWREVQESQIQMIGLSFFKVNLKHCMRKE
jgi:peptidoglycan/xylan/chitin deacetylase (PgdA/CDA1 family)